MATLNISIITFNCGREPIVSSIFASHLFNTLSQNQAPDVLALSLQEVAPIAYSFLGGSYLVPYFEKFHDAVRKAATQLDHDYINISTKNVGMTAILVYAKKGSFSDGTRLLGAAGVGVGFQRCGNKGAVGVRLEVPVVEGQEPMCMTFVAAHLAPMEDGLARRNQDWRNIVRGLVFDSSLKDLKSPKWQTPNEDQEPLLLSETHKQLESSMYSATSHLFFAGDLNYRTSNLKPGPADFQSYPQPAKDPNDPHHYSHLLADDQLSRELRAQKTCHGLQEAPIKFPPTYKYSNTQRAAAETDEDVRWDWSKHRWPSWCDRILYLALPPWMQKESPSAKITVLKYEALPLMATSDHRPVALSLSMPLKAIPSPDDEVTVADCRLQPPFAIDPHWKTKRASTRRLEVVIGLLAYLTLTWEGRVIAIGIALGAVGGWTIIVSMIET